MKHQQNFVRIRRGKAFRQISDGINPENYDRNALPSANYESNRLTITEILDLS